LNILAKNDADFSSFRNALHSKMKGMTSAAISTTENVADPLTLADDSDEELFSSSGTTAWLLNDIHLLYLGLVFAWEC
jgi:hypothetical protein